MLTVPEILSYITQILRDWGVMPFIQAAMLVVSVAAVYAVVRRVLSS